MNDRIDDKALLNYLEGKLPEPERLALEARLDEDPLVRDAVEGLRGAPSGKELAAIVERLNQHLHRQLAQPRARREKRNLGEGRWTLLAILLVLGLAVLAYWIIRELVARSS